MPPPRPLYARCGPPPVHSLHALRLAPWIFMIDRQRLALGGGVATGVVHINYAVTWTANQSGLVTVTLTFDLLTLKVVFESCVTCSTCVPILVFIGLSVLELFPMYATDRQTDVKRQTKASLNASALTGRGHKYEIWELGLMQNIKTIKTLLWRCLLADRKGIGLLKSWVLVCWWRW